MFEEVLKDYDEYDELCEVAKEFLVDCLNKFYNSLSELRDNICHIEVLKKRFGQKKNNFS